MSERTSARAKWCLGILVAGYLAIAVVAGAPRSPLTVLLPAGTGPPSWAADLARTAGLVGRNGLISLAWVLVLVVLAAFALLLREAWLRRVKLAAVLVASGISLAIAVAAPLLLSRDVYTYAAYGRIDALHHQNPYVATLSSFPHDPFVSVASAQWLHTHSLYGPVFTLLSAAIASTWAGSAAGTILAFKILAGVGIAAATCFAALAAARVRPERAALAAALIGLNPVIVVHTVGGAHVDALIAAPLAAAVAILVTRPPPRSVRALVITGLLAVACLIKAVIVPPLALWVWWVARGSPAHRGRILAAHLAVIAGLTLAAMEPFLGGWHTLAPFTTFGGVEAWASPSHLVGRGAQAIADSLAGSSAGADAARVVEVAFLALFAWVVWCVARRIRASDSLGLVEGWGAALLVLPLSMPYLLPWYGAWFVPFLGLLADEVLLWAGALVTGVLALTLIPADPFHGLTSSAVLDGVHYGAASVLLVVLLVVAFRASTNRTVSPTAGL